MIHILSMWYLACVWYTYLVCVTYYVYHVRTCAHTKCVSIIYFFKHHVLLRTCSARSRSGLIIQTAQYVGVQSIVGVQSVQNMARFCYWPSWILYRACSYSLSRKLFQGRFMIVEDKTNKRLPHVDHGMNSYCKCDTQAPWLAKYLLPHIWCTALYFNTWFIAWTWHAAILPSMFSASELDGNSRLYIYTKWYI